MKTINKKGLVVIDCEEMTLTEKDVIKIKRLEDFEFLISNHSMIFKLENNYYIKELDTIYIYEAKKK